MRHKLLPNLFVICFLNIITFTTIKAQSSCPVFVPKAATFVSANKTPTVGSMSYVLDGEGSTGLPSNGYGNYGVYWLQSDNPVTFNFDMKTVSTISRVKFYAPWGFDEGPKNVTVRLYNGATLLGTEAILLPSKYPTGYIALLSKAYANVTKIQMVIVDDYNISSATPKRTSLTEVVFGDTACTDTDGDTVADYLDLDNDNDGIKDIDENCYGFVAQNTTGKWLGQTASTLTATLTGATPQTNIQELSDEQIKYEINQKGGDTRYAKNGITNFTYTFSNPVPANEIAFFISDLDPSISGTSAKISFKINNGDPNGNFTDVSYGSTNNYLSYNTITGAITIPSNGLDDQNLLLKGVGNTLVSSITITSTGISASDAVAYSLFSNVPCDIDNDGIPNIFDLNSDNDSCVDAIEGSGSFTSAQLTSVSGTLNSQIPNQNFGISVDANGIPTVVGSTGQGNGQSKDISKNDCIDSDSDGYPDWQDLDDDNDGILDTVECPTMNYFPVYHLYDLKPADSTNPLWLYKLKNGIGSGFIYPNGDNASAPNGEIYFTTNIIGSVDNLAYDDGKYYTINAAGDLLYTNDIMNVNFASIGNAQIGTGYKNLAFDNGVFYHWKYISSVLTLYRSTDPVNNGWDLVGTINNRPYSYTSGGYTYELKDIAVNNNTFYFYYMNTVYVTNDLRTRVFSSTNPVSSLAVWTDLGSTFFGTGVYNYAYGSEDVLTVCDKDGDKIPNFLDLDSDNDGCPDAIEGGNNFTKSNLTDSTMSGGNIGATSGTYNQPVIKNLGNTVGNTSTTMGVPTIAGTGQTLGDSQNSTINSQCNICYKPAQTSGTALDTNHGITALGRAGVDTSNWPMIRKGAWTALEAKTKGFVVNRLTDAEIIAIPESELVEGMMLYNTTQNCLQINIDGTATGWKCINTQTCPD